MSKFTLILAKWLFMKVEKVTIMVVVAIGSIWCPIPVSEPNPGRGLEAD